MNTNDLFLHRGYFVQSKTTNLTEDYIIGKVNELIYLVIRKRCLWNSFCCQIQIDK
jgi:hypothetical protein